MYTQLQDSLPDPIEIFEYVQTTSSSLLVGIGVKELRRCVVPSLSYTASTAGLVIVACRRRVPLLQNAELILSCLDDRLVERVVDNC
jgi:hypothetical protein